MEAKKLFYNLQLAGEILVLFGAMIWMSGWPLAVALFFVGSLMVAVGRLVSGSPQDCSVTIRRLYIQRTVGAVFLLFSAIMMACHGWLSGMHIFGHTLIMTPSAWLLPFAVFVVIELYTVFRLSHEEKNKQA